MRLDARTLWVGLAKFLAVIVGGTAVGAGIGIALSALSGNGGNESKRLTDQRRARLRFGSEVISVKLDISA